MKIRRKKTRILRIASGTSMGVCEFKLQHHIPKVYLNWDKDIQKVYLNWDDDIPKVYLNWDEEIPKVYLNWDKDISKVYLSIKYLFCLSLYLTIGF